MGLFSRKPPLTIKLRYIDAATGKLLGRCKMPVEKLPESFESHTTVHVGDTDWDVVEAVPITSAEFRRTGRLDLRVSRVDIQTVDPKNVLFSLPTVSDGLTPIVLGSTKLGKNVLEIHEDDFRQIEWVAASVSQQALVEIAAIQKIQNEREEYGFRRIHVREGMAEPLIRAAIPIDALKQFFPNAAWLDGLSYHGVAGLAVDAFALRTAAGTDMYGLVRAGILHAVCFTRNSAATDIEALCQFASAHDLILVDWCRCEITDADAERYSKLLVRR